MQMPSVMMPKKRQEKDESGLAIPAGLFIGIGVGFLLSDIVPWLFIGLGGGFLVMLISKLVKSSQ